MSHYQVIARKFRPQFFREVVGQEAIVTTLQNALCSGRLAHAYLFCGPRGTGKTTLARLLAKAANCPHRTEAAEPCHTCLSCREITAGTSLDVLEIDGASHRGIEDIRQLNDTVGYAPASGRYKIYLIDEVHMLTKEAFNALLKTLEEPPPHVTFLFATTEPHKVLPTVLSRCQRFHLTRLSPEQIVSKLRLIAQQLAVDAEEEALVLLARRAEGGLRDAESLFDQVCAFSSRVTVDAVTRSLGLVPKEIYFALDRAGHSGQLEQAFDIARWIFAEGKEVTTFVEGLLDHLRDLLLLKLSPNSPFLFLSSEERTRYIQSASFYSQEQCLALMDELLKMQQQIRTSPFSRLTLEILLLRVIQSHGRLSLETLVQRLVDLESRLSAPLPPSSSSLLPPHKEELLPSRSLPRAAITEDPTPTAADLGRKTSPPLKRDSSPLREEKQEISIPIRPPHAYDTLLQFAAVELDGKLQRKT